MFVPFQGDAQHLQLLPGATCPPDGHIMAIEAVDFSELKI